MPFRFAPTVARTLFFAAVAALGIAASTARASAEALLLIDTDSGRVLHAENAGYPWHPASISKIMTTYVTLQAVKEGRIKLDTLITVSERALAEQPSKMGFPVGTRMTVDNALKMLMVKSANDMAVVLAEGVSGTVEAFAAEMNKTSARLGMSQSSWVNPNGLPADGQITSARDMAILARALIREFPQHDLYWRLPAIKFGRRVMRNYNKLIDRYPGADGMKTGFICASGYNMVATATRNGKRLIAVVLGAPSGTQRAETAARLLERGFQVNALSWFTSSLGSVESIQPIAASPPNLREEICGRGRKNRTDHAEEEQAQGTPSSVRAFSFLPGTNGAAGMDTASPIGPLTESMPPVVISVIPPQGSAAQLEESMNRPRKPRRGKIARGKGKGRQTAVIPTGDKPAPKTAKPKGAPTKPARARVRSPKSAAPKAASPKAPAKTRGKAAAAASNPKP